VLRCLLGWLLRFWDAAAESQSTSHTNRLIHSSEVGPAVLSCLAQTCQSAAAPAAPDGAQLRAQMLHTLLAFSYHPATCDQLVGAGALQLLGQLLQQAAGAEQLSTGSQADDSQLPLLLEQLWNLLELACTQKVAEAMQSTSGAYELVSAAAAAFERLLRQPGDRKSKELRNDALAVLQRLCGLPVCAKAARACGLLDTVIAILVAPEAAAMELTASGAAHALTRDPLDTEMRLMLWSAAVNAAEVDPGCLEALTVSSSQSCSFMSMLLQETEPGTAAALPHVTELAARVAPEHRAMLRRDAWSALLRVAPLAKRAFLEDCGGAAALVRCLHHVCAAAAASSPVDAAAAWQQLQAGSSGRRAPSAGATFQSNHSLGDSGAGMALEAPARLVARLCSGEGGGEAAAALVGQGALAPLLQLLRRAPPQAPEGVRQAALLALSAACVAGGPAALKALRDRRGVAVLVEELEG
jgi:hypothetical protein